MEIEKISDCLNLIDSMVLKNISFISLEDIT